MTVARKYQLKGVRKINHFDGRALVADEMGLGKTFTSLLWAHEHQDRSFPIVTVCPAHLKWNWQREAAHHFGIRAEVLEGRSPPPLSQWRRRAIDSELTIINYDILSSWIDHLDYLAPELVILDEIHFIKNRSAKRTKAVNELCHHVPHVIGLSGTPVTNRPSDIYSIVHLLRPDLFPSFWSFADRYCEPRRTRWGWEYKGATHLDELHEILNSSMMIRRLKRDVLHELPEKVSTIVPLDIKSRREYREASSDFLSWLKKKSPSKERRARKAERVVKMGYLRRLAAELKIESVSNWIDDFLCNSDESLIVFGIHQNVIRPIYENFKSHSVFMDGSTSSRKRQAAVDRLQSGKSRLLISNDQAGGTGFNMTRASSVAMVEIPWTPAAINQCIDRSHRLGQKKRVDAYFLVAKDTVEERLCEIVADKQGVASTIIDGVDAVHDLDIFDRLEDEMKKGLIT